MDNLTHSLAGWAIARAGLGRVSPGATAALVLASNVPDLDIVAGLAGTASYLAHHRDLTHSVVGVVPQALLLAAALTRFVKGARFGPLFGCALLGLSLHVVMDLWTSYGTRALTPLMHDWFAWDLVFIVDPWILLALGGGIFLSRRLDAARSARLALLACALYVGARGVAHDAAVRATIAAIDEPVYRVAALPEPVDPLRWRVLADAGSAYHVGALRLGDGPPVLERRARAVESPLVARVRESSAVAAIFLDFSRWPWLEVEPIPGGQAVVWSDLRFDFPERRGFVTRVEVDAEGRILSERFEF
jgi:inner membrane protein